MSIIFYMSRDMQHGSEALLNHCWSTQLFKYLWHARDLGMWLANTYIRGRNVINL